ncbi:unnamed protein product [Adineta ricciae]|uniref:Uncharacterized protein n=2 Tax=Adineta ricciae TaxID=249248 RepID=A0A813WYD9_ADIRI|nr:unnamed protein product [Adineta ricciae]
MLSRFQIVQLTNHDDIDHFPERVSHVYDNCLIHLKIIIAHSENERSGEETDISTDKRHRKESQTSANGFFTEPEGKGKKSTKIRRNPFKKAAFAILFVVFVKHRVHQNRSHRVYLDPDGPIFNALIQAITYPISLQHALNSSSRNYSEAIETIGNAMKDIVSKITQFMPKDGILGMTKTSAISIFLQNGNPFPDKYFWEYDKIGQITSSQSMSLKVLSSVLLHLGRRAAGTKSQLIALPNEWKLSLYTDVDMESIIANSQIKSIMNTCEHSLRIWCKEYVRRIDESYGKELRK